MLQARANWVAERKSLLKKHIEAWSRSRKAGPVCLASLIEPRWGVWLCRPIKQGPFLPALARPFNSINEFEPLFCVCVFFFSCSLFSPFVQQSRASNENLEIKLNSREGFYYYYFFNIFVSSLSLLFLIISCPFFFPFFCFHFFFSILLIKVI